MHDLMKSPGADLLLPEILEQQAFVFCDPVDKDSLAELLTDEAAVVARVAFSGPDGEGFCLFGATLGLGKQIASVLLNLEPDDDQLELLARDSLKEVANVTAGHLVTHCLDDEKQYTIEAPEVAIWESTRWHEAVQAPEALPYMADDYLVWVQSCALTPVPNC